MSASDEAVVRRFYEQMNNERKNELAPEFEAVAFSLEVGEISPVFVSPYGFHLVKLTERKPSVPRPFDEAREEVARHYKENAPLNT